MDGRASSPVCLLVGMVLLLAGGAMVPVAAQTTPLKLLAPDGAPGDRYGCAVAVGQGLIACGAPFDSDNGTASGSVYLYRQIGSGWLFDFKLLAPDGSEDDRFGDAIDIRSPIVAVGAPFGDGAQTSTGKVYLFDADDPVVPPVQLFATSGMPGDLFGAALDLDGSTLAIGAPGSDQDRGFVTIYRRTGGLWVPQAALAAPDGMPGDAFGCAVSLHRDVLLVGARGNDEAGSEAGAAYVYRRGNLGWMFTQKLLAATPCPGAEVGFSVHVRHNQIVLGARFADEAAPDAGSALTFLWDGSTWLQVSELTAADAEFGDRFGWSVAVRGTTIAVGCHDDDDAGQNSGAVYLFRRANGVWSQTQKLVALDATGFDFFGSSMALGDSLLLVGAPFQVQGAVYLYAIDQTVVSFRRGDASADGQLTIADPVLLLQHLFQGVPSSCRTALDANDDESVDLADGIALLTTLFGGGPPPAPPYPSCGEDTTFGPLLCDAFTGCP